MQKALAVLGVVLLVAVGYLYMKPTPTAPTPKAGSVTSSQTLTNPYCVDGFCHYDLQHGFALATTTPWAQTGPNATTTLGKYGCNFLTSSTTATTITLATSTNDFATTSLIGQFAIAANAQATDVASTTYNNGTIVPPNTHFVMGMAGGIGNFSPTGSCFIILTAVAPSSP